VGNSFTKKLLKFTTMFFIFGLKFEMFCSVSFAAVAATAAKTIYRIQTNINKMAKGLTMSSILS